MKMFTRPSQALPLRLLAAVIVSSGALTIASASQAQSAVYSSSPSVAERGRISQTVVRYLAMWNERDPERRRQMMPEVLAEDASYTDPNRHGVGYESIDGLIATAHRAFPAPYALRLVSTIEIHSGYLRFSFAAGGIADAPLYLAGTDFVTLADDGRIQSIVGFADAPAVAPPR